VRDDPGIGREESGTVSSTSDLAVLNDLPEPDLLTALSACCASSRWAKAMTAARPYAGLEGLLEASDDAVRELAPTDLDEALAGHPRIGDRTTHGSWSASEQSGMSAADAGLQQRIADGNRAYEEKFGHVYLVCATGKSADELHAILAARLGNDAETEHAVTKTELAKINRLRLVKLLDRLRDAPKPQDP
jgi:2-oxo-4-hydroxy-4-carboxy-5-ureidoimidazoline decarboxylase